jgi:hypothetical protein
MYSIKHRTTEIEMVFCKCNFVRMQHYLPAAQAFNSHYSKQEEDQEKDGLTVTKKHALNRT